MNQDKILAIKKGYQLSVLSYDESWANRQVINSYFDNLQDVKDAVEVLKFIRDNELDDKTDLNDLNKRAVSYLIRTHPYFKKNKKDWWEDEIYLPERWSDDECVEAYSDAITALLGEPDGNNSNTLIRYWQTYEVTYSPEDIYLDVVDL